MVLTRGERVCLTHQSRTGQVWKGLVSRSVVCSLSAGWLALPNGDTSVHGWECQPREPREPQGHQQDAPETATLSPAQVLRGTAVKPWLLCTAGLARDAARKMPCQVRQLVSPFPHPLSLPDSQFVSVL